MSSSIWTSGIGLLLMIAAAAGALMAGTAILTARRRRRPGGWKHAGWIALAAAALLAAVVQYGAVLGSAIGMEYPLSVPKALIALETGKARLVPLTSDAVRLVGRRGPAERELTAFLAERGWRFVEQTDAGFTYAQGDATLTVHSRFRRGYWWHELDRSPSMNPAPE
ncbi:hypothetical protein PAESOLCIP111_00029 [Paenibacillus solanacearum]|uniref:Uncharacterized protein n=1 Tax=Paenibacillus solanacearum TaxID=2048548 RepID=A0A916NK03_9BACL|nr:hypothetical protein [Paenibacillus solanacearum]CAG7595195.1 hypothetical protein PAESOLCIP111_00029 [Paenibacillus solanacearum]